MGITANRGLPYPESTDPIAAGAAAIQDLAESVDEQLPTAPDGTSSGDAGTVSTADVWTTGIAGGAGLPDVDVEVPGSGRVLILFGATIWLSAGTGLGSLGVRIGGTAHAVTDPSSVNAMHVATGDTRLGASKAFVVSGMVPGTTLTSTMVYKTAALTTTMSVGDRRLDVIPLP
jgi:hypothetical protein